MKLLATAILFCCSLLVILPPKSIAAFNIATKPIARNTNSTMRRPNSRNIYHHMQHFKGGLTHTFCGVLSLSCSMIGSVAVVAALTGVIVAAPVGVFAIAGYGFSLLGVVLGFISLSDSDGSTAVALGFANLFVLWLGGAIYQATLGNFLPLLKLVAIFVK